jgi:hypothetical protein
MSVTVDDSTGRTGDLKIRANELYATLIQEVRASGYDPFAKPDNDFAKFDAIERINADTLRRATVHGPSITKDKFTSKYWRKWHKEKILLEDISRKEAIKENRVTEENLKRSASSLRYLRPLPRKTDKNVTVYSFGNPLDKTTSKTYFDYHILGNANSPSVLYKTSQGRPVPTDRSEHNAPYDPSAIGGRNNVTGGSMAQMNYSQTRISKTETKRCDYPPLASMVSKSKGITFETSARFKAAPQETPTQSGVAAEGDSLAMAPNRFGGSTQFVFSREERTPAKSGAVVTSSPGPGAHDVPRLFDRSKLAPPVPEVVPAAAGLTVLHKPRMIEIGCFGHGCSRQEHVLYGMCLDGQCFTRAKVEGAIVRSNDLRRLAGYAAVERLGRNKEGLADEVRLSKAMTALVEDPVYAVSALYAAAYRGDIETIRRLAVLRVDSNARHPESGYTALHAAVFRCQVEAVQGLLEAFRGELDLSVQDRNGDTALLLGSRLGYDAIVGLICDEESCDPLCVRNHKGELPTDVNKSHRVYQHLRLAMDRNALRGELAALKSQSQQQQQQQQQSKRTTSQQSNKKSR